MSLTVAGTDYVLMPVGTTAQRPTTPAAGMTRFNSTTSLLEFYNGTTWLNAGGYSVDYLVVAGGGGAGKPNPGADRSGVGGAGGLLTSAGFFAVPTTAYTVTIGAGGAPGSASAEATNGSNTVFGSFTTTGGGAGGRYNLVGVAGGSGGGGGSLTAGLTGGATTTGQIGYVGGTGIFGGSGGGGGGAGSAGSGSTAGSGLSSSYSGAAVTYAAGGAGGSGSVGAANSGNGGGNLSTQYVDNFAGGSGIVIIRYLGSQRGTGGTVTSSGGYTIHTFTTSSTFTA